MQIVHTEIVCFSTWFVVHDGKDSRPEGKWAFREWHLVVCLFIEFAFVPRSLKYCSACLHSPKTWHGFLIVQQPQGIWSVYRAKWNNIREWDMLVAELGIWNSTIIVYLCLFSFYHSEQSRNGDRADRYDFECAMSSFGQSNTVFMYLPWRNYIQNVRLDTH